ncbi:MAG: hypothetical protein ACI33P_13300 [Lysinibacillus sp.]
MEKLWRSPVIWILLAVFLGFNSFYIWSEIRKGQELAVLNDIVATYGKAIDEEALAGVKKEIEQKAEALGSQQGAAAYLDSMTPEFYYEQSEEVQWQIDELSLYAMYAALAGGLEERYKEVDIQAIGEDEKKTYGLSGVAASWMDGHFAQLEKRFETYMADESYNEWFFAGDPYRMHSFLFRSVVKMIALEGILLTVLMTAYLVAYEREQRTHLLVFASKMGRGVMKKKAWAASIATVGTGILLMIGTLVVFFSLHDYSGLWGVNVGSGLNWEYRDPYVFWWDIPLWQYLLLAVAIIFISWLIIMLVTFAMAVRVQNSYIVSITILIILLALFVVPSYFTFSPLLMLASHFNLMLLVLNPHMLFNGLSGMTGFWYHELLTLGIFTLLAVVLAAWSLKRFKRKDLHE